MSFYTYIIICICNYETYCGLLIMFLNVLFLYFFVFKNYKDYQDSNIFLNRITKILHFYVPIDKPTFESSKSLGDEDFFSLGLISVKNCMFTKG